MKFCILALLFASACGEVTAQEMDRPPFLGKRHNPGNGVSSSPAACTCSQIATNAVVRGRTTVEEEGQVDYCSTSGDFTNADAGQFVACAANTPRFMNGAILNESAGGVYINSIVVSTKFDAADWQKIGVVSAAPTVTADQVLAPDGTMTGDQVLFPSTSASALSTVAVDHSTGNSGCPAGATSSGRVYVMGKTGGGTLDLGIYDGATYQCASTAYTTGTWTALEKDNITSGPNGNFVIGNLSLVCGGTTRPTQTVYLWAGECGNSAGPLGSPVASTDLLANGQVWTRMPDQVENISLTRTAVLGDSLSANTVASTGSTQVYPRWPERYAADSSRTVDNWAVNGATFTTNCETQWNIWAKRTSPQRLAIFCGINDIVIGAVNGHALWATYQTWIEGLSPMPTLYLFNLLPFGDYSGYTTDLDTQRLNFNSDMAAYCLGHPSVHCIDAESAMWSAGDHTKLNATYKAPDGLHLNQTGANALGDYVFSVAP